MCEVVRKFGMQPSPDRSGIEVGDFKTPVSRHELASQLGRMYADVGGGTHTTLGEMMRANADLEREMR